MANWVRVASRAEVPPGTGKEVHTTGRVIALFNVGGSFYALDGICPHQGGPLGEGELEGTTVTCPWHGWQFDVCGGKNLLNPRIEQGVYEVRVEDGEILLCIE